VPLLLARIDDRLIHGQVAHGWGGLFIPRSSRSSPTPSGRIPIWRASISSPRRGRPRPGRFGRGSARPGVPEGGGRGADILLFAGIEDALRLLEGGFAIQELNLGGLHHSPGKSEVLPYVFLDDADRARLRALKRRGVRVYAQDLPSNSSHAVDAWVGEAT